MKKVFCLMGIILLATSSVKAQDTIINQDFLLDPEAEKMLSPNEEAIINAEESAKRLLNQKPRLLRKRSFPKLRSKPTAEDNTKDITRNQVAPFGLVWKSTVTATRNQGISLTKIEEKDYPNSYSATDLPKKIDDFARVDVSFGKEDKLWRIIAYGKLLDDDASATKVLRLYNIYSSLLAKKYGNKKEFFTPAEINVVTKDSSGREKIIKKTAPLGNPEFLSQLQSGKAVLYSTYNNNEIGAALAINVDGDGKSYIVLDYKNLGLLYSKEKKTLDAL
ncbi:MAG: hypothetical protein IJV97_03905 [Alphaproteobacteria bacterium]|nr:hypothetical protein [Alphaproteobacteria bacterium]